MSEITPEVSQRICKHMNDDHHLSVYAMVTSTLDNETSNMKISNCKLDSVSLTKLSFSFVACDDAKGVCVPKTTVINFDPPLQSSAEARSRLVEMHHQSLAPKLSWYITDPVTRTGLLIIGSVVATYLMGFDTFVRDLQSIETYTSIKVQDFVSIESLFNIISKLAQLSIILHALEGFYVVYLCSKLKLKISNTVLWFVVTFVSGVPMTMKVMKFSQIQDKSKKHD